MNSNKLKQFLKKQEKPDFIQQFRQSLVFASERTKEYMGFRDPKSGLRIASSTLNDIFLMSYMNRSLQGKLPTAISCTKMTSEQSVLLGADWVWAVEDLASTNPKLQIAVQAVHPEQEEAVGGGGGGGTEEIPQPVTETMRLAQAEATLQTKPQKMVDFCSSIGRDCYGLFLFFGCRDDPKNVYGVLSNSFHSTASAEHGEEPLDSRSLEDNTLGKAKSFVSPEKMLEMVLQGGNEVDGLKPICVKFTQ